MPIYSYERFIASGETADFNINFDYLSSSHIEVYLDGVQQSSTGLSPDFSIDSSTNKVTFTSTPASGAVVLIKRVTPKDKAEYQAQIADFTDGSVLTAKDLDNASLGLLFIAQEAEDSGNTNALSIDQNDLQWDAENKRIKNVGTPTGSSDATTKSYVDGQALYNNPTVPQVYTFEASADQTEFTLDPQPTSSDPDSFFVDIDGSMKRPTADFTVSGDTLTLTTGASNGQLVTVRNIGVTRDILGDNPTVTGNLSVSGTLGSTGAATMSSTLGVTGATTLSDNLGVTGATTMTGGVAGNLNILTGALQMAGSDVMTIRQFIMQSSLTSSENSALDGGKWTQAGSSSTAYKVSGLRVSVPALKSSSSKLIIIMTPLIYGFSSTGNRTIDVVGKIYKNNTASMTNNVNGSVIDESFFRNRQNVPDSGVSITGSISETDIGAFPSGVFTPSNPGQFQVDCADEFHTHSIDVPSHTHGHALTGAYSGTAHSYIRPTWFYVIDSPDTGATTYDLAVSANHANTSFYFYPTSAYSQMIAIEIG